MAVVLVQLLCPDRHCITAVASGEKSPEEMIALFKTMIALGIERHALNPWCGLCGAPADTWQYEATRTPWPTMEEAMPILRTGEQGQIQYARVQREAGLAYDKDPGAQN